MGFTLYLFLVFSFTKGLILILFCMCGTLERAYLMEPIPGRLQNLMATVDDQETHEMLEDNSQVSGSIVGRQFKSVEKVFNQMKT